MNSLGEERKKKKRKPQNLPTSFLFRQVETDEHLARFFLKSLFKDCYYLFILKLTLPYAVELLLMAMLKLGCCFLWRFLLPVINLHFFEIVQQVLCWCLFSFCFSLFSGHTWGVFSNSKLRQWNEISDICHSFSLPPSCLPIAPLFSFSFYNAHGFHPSQWPTPPPPPFCPPVSPVITQGNAFESESLSLLHSLALFGCWFGDVLMFPSELRCLPS